MQNSVFARASGLRKVQRWASILGSRLCSVLFFPVAVIKMPDFDNKQNVQDAINTLNAQQQNAANNAGAVGAAEQELAARVAAAYQQNDGTNVNADSRGEFFRSLNGFNGPQAQAQAQAQMKAMQEAQAQTQQGQAQGAATPEGMTGVASESMHNASFNANGDPDYPDANISFAHDGEDDTDLEMENRAYLAGDESEELVELAEQNKELQEEVTQLKGMMDMLKQAMATEHDKMLRAVAEADNVRKRAEQDVDRERKYALEKFVRALLPVYDALEKALEFSDRNNEATKATIDGVENTLTLFLKELGNFGVQLEDPTGKPFDPNFHQAISMVPSTDVPNNHVLNTVQKGFLLNGRVVRAAMVIVAKQP